jgi:hypothetical protein
LSGLNVSIADTLRPSALHPGFFLAIAGSLGFEIVSKLDFCRFYGITRRGSNGPAA